MEKCIYIYFRLLNCISNLTNNKKSKDLWLFLESVYSSKLPIKGCDLKVNNDNGEEVISIFINILYKYF